MKAAILHDLNRLSIEEVPTPEIDADSALMKVRAVSICGSDVRIMRHGNPRVIPPAIIGHEAAGEIVEVGANVKHLREGNRVAISADVPCGQCDWCRNGLGHNCEINYAIGYQIPGAYAEYMLLPKLVIDSAAVTPFGDDLGFDEASLAEPLACAINGLELVQMSLGKTLVIIGMGPIGCMMIDLARVMGAAKIICIQRSRLRLEIAQRYGADKYILTEDGDVVQRVLDETGGRGAGAIVTTCGSPEAHEQAVDMVAHRGFVNFFGGLGKDARPITLYSNKIHYRESFVTGSHGSVPRQHKLAVGLIERGSVRVQPIITHRFPLTDIASAFDAMESRKGMKVVLHPHDGG
jgi:L-iditol 2-dehydrogenase